MDTALFSCGKFGFSLCYQIFLLNRHLIELSLNYIICSAGLTNRCLKSIESYGRNVLPRLTSTLFAGSSGRESDEANPPISTVFSLLKFLYVPSRPSYPSSGSTLFSHASTPHSSLPLPKHRERLWRLLSA